MKMFGLKWIRINQVRGLNMVFYGPDFIIWFFPSNFKSFTEYAFLKFKYAVFFSN